MKITRQIMFGAAALAACGAWASTRVTVTIRDWTGKEVRTVSGLTDTGTFSLDAADYFNAPVDYVTAFDGGTVSAAPSTDVASGSVVTWEGVTKPLTTEIFVQPRVAYKNFAKYLMGDPWVVKNPTADVWYVTYTKATTGLSVYRTTVFPTNVFGSSRTGYNFKTHSEDVGAYTNYIWAPEIHCIQDRWYAYISASSSATSSNYERPFALRLEGDNPYSSNWKMGAKLVTPGGDRWAIDGTILDDTAASGRLYYIWSGWPSTANGVQNLYIAEMSSPTSFVQNAERILISAPTESWETKTTSPCKVNEGPVVLRHGNAVHIVYSCNGCWTDDYSLALLTCTDGNFLNPSSWTKSSQRLFVSRPGAYGPGHCSFTRTADGQDMIVYHAKYVSGHSSDYYSYRDIRMQPIAWHGDYPVFGAPRPYDGTLASDPLDLNADYAIADPKPAVVWPLGDTLETLTPTQKQFLAWSADVRSNMFDNAEYRAFVGSRTNGWCRPVPHLFRWTGDGACTVTVYRASDSRVHFTAVSATNAVFVDNFEIGQDYRWTVANAHGASEGAFSTEGQAPRLLRDPDPEGRIFGVRDLGGWVGLGGRRVRQNLAFRTSEFNWKTPSEEAPTEPGESYISDANRSFWLDWLGVRTDLDLRKDTESKYLTESPLGPTVNWQHITSYSYKEMLDKTKGREAFVQDFDIFLDTNNYPIAFHCAAGQDRTGCLAYVLNGILGVADDELMQDWEATIFWNTNCWAGTAIYWKHVNIDPFVARLKTYPGTNMCERCCYWVTNLCGVSSEKLEAFRSIMLEDYSPQPGPLPADTNAVTYTWCGAAGGAWTNAANWAADVAPNRGYPDSTLATAVFLGDAAVDGAGASVTAKYVKMGAHAVRFTDLNLTALATDGDNCWKLPKGSTLTLDGGKLTLRTGTGGDGRLSIRNGANVAFLNGAAFDGQYAVDAWGQSSIGSITYGNGTYAHKWRGYSKPDAVDLTVTNATVKVTGSAVPLRNIAVIEGGVTFSAGFTPQPGGTYSFVLPAQGTASGSEFITLPTGKSLTLTNQTTICVDATACTASGTYPLVRAGALALQGGLSELKLEASCAPDLTASLTNDATTLSIVLASATPGGDYPTWIDSKDAETKQKYDTWSATHGVMDPSAAKQDAYLLNCANTDAAIKEAKDAFQIKGITVGSDGTVTVDPPSGDYNGTIRVRGDTDVEGDYDLDETDSAARFFKAFLEYTPSN